MCKYDYLHLLELNTGECKDGGKYTKAQMARERLTISIDGELKRRFDIVCRWKNQNMSEVAQELFTEWIGENAPPGLFELETKPTKDNEPPTSGTSSGKGRGKKGDD